MCPRLGRQSKADEQMKGDIKKMAEHDGQLLRVIESYCQLGKTELRKHFLICTPFTVLFTVEN